MSTQFVGATTPNVAAANAALPGGLGLYGAMGRPGYPGMGGMYPGMGSPTWNTLGYNHVMGPPAAMGPMQSPPTANQTAPPLVPVEADILVDPPGSTNQSSTPPGNVEYQEILKANTFLFACLSEMQQKTMATNIYDFLTLVRGRRFIHRNNMGGNYVGNVTHGWLMIKQEISSTMCRAAAHRKHPTWIIDGLVSVPDVEGKKALWVRRDPQETNAVKAFSPLTLAQLQKFLADEGFVNLVLLPAGVKPAKAKGVAKPAVEKKKRGPKKKTDEEKNGDQSTSEKKKPGPKKKTADAEENPASEKKKDEDTAEKVEEEEKKEETAKSTPAKRGAKRKSEPVDEDKKPVETKPAKKGRKKKEEVVEKPAPKSPAKKKASPQKTTKTLVKVSSPKKTAKKASPAKKTRPKRSR